jgi:hypothetical protein
MTQLGIPRLYVSKILNHSEAGDITAIYDRHSYDKEKREALERWNAKLEAIGSKPEEKPKAKRKEKRA